ARARPAVRLDALRALGVSRRRAGEPAANAAREARTSAVAQRATPLLRASLRRSRASRSSERARCGAAVAEPPLGSRDLRRRSDLARPRARRAGSTPPRGAGGAPLPSPLRRAIRRRSHRRAGLGLRQRRLRDVAERARPTRR